MATKGESGVTLPYTEEQLRDQARKCFVLERLIPGLMRYIFSGIPPGSFLKAVLENDLSEAFSRADEESAVYMKQLCTFLYSYAPAGCKGSREKVETWRSHQGLKGLMEAHEAKGTDG